jgi:hypothetical protein
VEFFEENYKFLTRQPVRFSGWRGARLRFFLPCCGFFKNGFLYLHGKTHGRARLSFDIDPASGPPDSGPVVGRGWICCMVDGECIGLTDCEFMEKIELVLGSSIGLFLDCLLVCLSVCLSVCFCFSWPPVIVDIFVCREDPVGFSWIMVQKWMYANLVHEGLRLRVWTLN